MLTFFSSSGSAGLSVLLLLLQLTGELTSAIPLGNFYPFGTASEDFSLYPSDDGFMQSINLNVSFVFYGSRHQTVTVCMMLANWILVIACMTDCKVSLQL